MSHNDIEIIDSELLPFNNFEEILMCYSKLEITPELFFKYYYHDAVKDYGVMVFYNEYDYRKAYAMNANLPSKTIQKTLDFCNFKITLDEFRAYVISVNQYPRKIPV